MVNTDDVLGALQDSSGAEVSAAMQAVRNHAEAILKGEQGAGSKEILKQIETVWAASDSHCAAKSPPPPLLGTSSTTGTFANSVGPGEVGPSTQAMRLRSSNPPKPRDKELEDTSSQLWILGVVMAVLILGVLSLWAIREARRLFRARRTGCRISAGFESDLDVVDGYIIELSRRRLVFKPVNTGAFKRMCLLLTDVGDEGKFVIFSDVRIEVFVDEIGEGAIMFRMTPALTRVGMNTVLGHSLISPFTIQEISPTEKARLEIPRPADARADAA